MFDVHHAQKVLTLLKNRDSARHGLKIVAWFDEYDLGDIDSGEVVLFFDRPDEKTSFPRPEEVLLWVREGMISTTDVYIATDKIDVYVSAFNGDQCPIDNIDVTFSVRGDEESEDEYGFAVVVKGMKLDFVDTMAPTTATVSKAISEEVFDSLCVATICEEVKNKAATQAELCAAVSNKSANHILFVDD